MIITYTHEHKHTKSHVISKVLFFFFFFEIKNNKIEKSRGQRRGKREETKGGEKALLTDAHSGQDKIIVRTTTDRDKRLGLHKVDPTQRGVARLQTPKVRPFRKMHIILVKGLRCLLRRALRLARVVVLDRKHWNCSDVVHDWSLILSL
jgi:hypothetical protein